MHITLQEYVKVLRGKRRKREEEKDEGREEGRREGYISVSFFARNFFFTFSVERSAM